MAWLALGVVAGLGISYLMPHEPALAQTDRDDKFAMCVAATGLGGADAIFVLDFLTGRLQGAALNPQSGAFTQLYFRNVAADFRVDPNVPARYAILSGLGNLPSQRGITPAASVIYVGELNSGRVLCYSFSFRVTQRPTPPTTLGLIGGFPFREAARDD
jgi:hypothetical protein